MADAIRVLIVEDSDDGAAQLVEELRRAGFDVVLTRVASAGDLELALKGGEYDIIVSDYSLASSNAGEALEILNRSGLDIPFIVVSGIVHEGTIVDAMRGGARDYVVRGDLTRLPHAVRRELAESVERRRRRGFEEQLRHTQRLESIGLLAGGIAHDFNNLLTGVLGNSTLVLEALHESSPHRAPLERVVKAAEKAAHLIRQLLAYAGKGRFLIEPLNLSDVVRDILPLLHVSVPRHVDLRLSLREPVPLIRADRGQMQQLIMNLAINAAEAIEDGVGAIIISTGIEALSEDDLAKARIRDQAGPGFYVCFEVRDNGSGMDEQTAAKIFDPFFTTKFTGRGLGLSAVMGIVRGHGGALQVTSKPGVGSTFTVHFPAADPRAVPAPDLARGSLKSQVLVIDDERTVRQTCRAMLERAGYEVLVAENGKEGLDLFAAFSDRISLILLDLAMPVLSGDRTLDGIRSISPDVPVLAMTGYSETEALERFAGKGATGFISKPFTRARLVDAIARATGAPSSEAARVSRRALR